MGMEVREPKSVRILLQCNDIVIYCMRWGKIKKDDFQDLILENNTWFS